MPGHALHFHLLPLHDWISRAFARDVRYHTLQSLNPPDYPIAPDAAELIAFVWREYCATGHCPVDDDREHVAAKLRDYITTYRSTFGL